MSLTEPRFLGAAIGVLVAAGALLVLRRRWPAGIVAALAFAILVSPVLGVLQSGPQLVAERYSYLATIPCAMLAGGGWLAWSRRGRGAWSVGLPVAAIVLGALSLLTFRQSGIWLDSDALFRHTHRVRPESPMGWLYVGSRQSAEADAATDPVEREAPAPRGAGALRGGARATRDAPAPDPCGARARGARGARRARWSRSREALRRGDEAGAPGDGGGARERGVSAEVPAHARNRRAPDGSGGRGDRAPGVVHARAVGSGGRMGRRSGGRTRPAGRRRMLCAPTSGRSRSSRETPSPGGGWGR